MVELDRVELVNAYGQLIDTFIPSSYPIEVPTISASGIYYLRIVDTLGNVYTEKLIVK